MPALIVDAAADIVLRDATVQDAGEVLTLQLAARVSQGSRHRRSTAGAIEALAPDEARRFVLTTGPDSPDNIAFYERNGYRRIAPDESVGPLHIVHLAKEHP